MPPLTAFYNPVLYSVLCVWQDGPVIVTGFGTSHSSLYFMMIFSVQEPTTCTGVENNLSE